MIKTRVFPEENYKGIHFNGKTFRVALDNTKPISELKFPEFYDLKITNQCLGICPYCYMDSKPTGSHALNIVNKVKDHFGSMNKNQRPFQVAIGGGEPTSHPENIDLLVALHTLDILPNYTTNGMFIDDHNLADQILKSTKRYCGGVAVSCHEHLNYYWMNSAQLLHQQGTKLNFHIIISDRDSIDRCMEIIQDWNDRVDYFVLLPYGVQGRAEQKEIDWEYLVSSMPEDITKLAFGANFYPYLLNNKGRKINVSLYEPECMSKFIDMADMKTYPSSFNLVEI